MPYFIILSNWTDQGIKNVKESPKRVAQAKALVEKTGGKWLGLWYTFGLYDMVTLVESDNDKSALINSLAVAMGGNIRTITLKAFSAEEGAKLIAKLP